MLISCDEMFDTHPYDVDFSGKPGINDKQIAKIRKALDDKDTLRIAFISDTHLWLSDARDEVVDLNRRTGCS